MPRWTHTALRRKHPPKPHVLLRALLETDCAAVAAGAVGSRLHDTAVGESGADAGRPSRRVAAVEVAVVDHPHS